MFNVQRRTICFYMISEHFPRRSSPLVARIQQCSRPPKKSTSENASASSADLGNDHLLTYIIVRRGAHPRNLATRTLDGDRRDSLMSLNTCFPYFRGNYEMESYDICVVVIGWGHDRLPDNDGDIIVCGREAKRR